MGDTQWRPQKHLSLPFSGYVAGVSDLGISFLFLCALLLSMRGGLTSCILLRSFCLICNQKRHHRCY